VASATDFTPPKLPIEPKFVLDLQRQTILSCPLITFDYCGQELHRVFDIREVFAKTGLLVSRKKGAESVGVERMMKWRRCAVQICLQSLGTSDKSPPNGDMSFEHNALPASPLHNSSSTLIFANLSLL